jgi:hypothetical protein
LRTARNTATNQEKQGTPVGIAWITSLTLGAIEVPTLRFEAWSGAVA